MFVAVSDRVRASSLTINLHVECDRVGHIVGVGDVDGHRVGTNRRDIRLVLEGRCVVLPASSGSYRKQA